MARIDTNQSSRPIRGQGCHLSQLVQHLFLQIVVGPSYCWRAASRGAGSGPRWPSSAGGTAPAARDRGVGEACGRRGRLPQPVRVLQQRAGRQGWIFIKDSSQNMLAFFRIFWSKWVRKSNIWNFLKMSQDIKYLEIFILGYSFTYEIHESYSCRRPTMYDQLCMQSPWYS